jgi:hypothetical protein
MLRSTKTTLGLAALLVVGWASAQSEDENRAAARALGIEGIKLANEGDCAAAVDKLSRAAQLFPAPTIVGRLGECQVELGRVVAGTENLQKVVREQLAADAPPAFVEAQERARGVLDRALPRIAKLTVQVLAPAGTSYQVTLDGRPLPVALVGVERPIDPGSHEVSVTAPGCAAAKQSVTLPDGGAESVTLTLSPVAPNLVPTPAAPTSSAAPPTVPAASVEPAPSSSGRTWGYVSLGLGGVGLALGTVFGVSAMGKKSDLEKVCSGGRCPPSAQSGIDSMNTSATLSTVGFAVGIVGVGFGTYLLLTSGRSSEAGAPASAGLFLGPGSAHLVGRF